ncbi:hypothetical protein CDAR_280641 [Caerostris darwini]|uniref:Uncharacterized protein n=1 Tax=Caerostris darwini TaxID=1538125 RepID=A0AAV4MDI4_9ARAC|nr:hypothetical protein CDAR_280641 [Caerostris darwini]
MWLRVSWNSMGRRETLRKTAKDKLFSLKAAAWDKQREVFVLLSLRIAADTIGRKTKAQNSSQQKVLFRCCSCLTLDSATSKILKRKKCAFLKHALPVSFGFF